MTPEEIAAIGACIAAVGTLMTGVAVMLTSIRAERNLGDAAKKLASKTEETASVTESKLDDIHVLVNSRLTEALDKIDILEKRLGESTVSGKEG